MLTKTDASGNWSYAIKKSLVDGDHKVYITINDETGKIVKQSNSLSFLVKSAQAVSAADYFDINTSEDKTDFMILYYICQQPLHRQFVLEANGPFWDPVGLSIFQKCFHFGNIFF